tara:strand:- start:271 stop:1080 length:810 start_codon:yes stop_codon:yes gene_type:complete
MNRIIRYLGTEYKFDYHTAISKLETVFPMESFTEESGNAPTENNVIMNETTPIINTVIMNENAPTINTVIMNETTPVASLLGIIDEQKIKEERTDIWKNSHYKHLPGLQSNNIGNVGEMFLGNICKNANIESDIDGTKTKKIGGGAGDGIIKGKTVEIKTAHCGGNTSYQHELGEFPWHAEYMAFIDVDPQCVYLTIFPNFTEEQYKNCVKCEPYFPTRSFCWRKKSGAFKLDTTPKLNEQCILQGNAIKITEETTFESIGEFIQRIIM